MTAGWLVHVMCMLTSRPNLALALVQSSTVSSDVEPPAPACRGCLIRADRAPHAAYVGC